jgi:hypothetical protein
LVVPVGAIAPTKRPKTQQQNHTKNGGEKTHSHRGILSVLLLSKKVDRSSGIGLLDSAALKAEADGHRGILCSAGDDSKGSLLPRPSTSGSDSLKTPLISRTSGHGHSHDASSSEPATVHGHSHGGKQCDGHHEGHGSHAHGNHGHGK